MLKFLHRPVVIVDDTEARRLRAELAAVRGPLPLPDHEIARRARRLAEALKLGEDRAQQRIIYDAMCSALAAARDGRTTPGHRERRMLNDAE